MLALRSALLLSSLMALIGCSKESGHPAQVPVQGTITLDGKPLSGAMVQFIPVGSTPGFASIGRTGAKGEYTLTGSRGGKGVCPGSFQVVVNKFVLPDGGDVPEKTTQSPMELKATETLAPHYSQPGKSVLKATVPAGGGTIDFALKAKGK